MSRRPDPHAQSTCRLCLEGKAKVRFTEDANVIDVSCPTCGQFRFEIPGYHLDLNGLTREQRVKLLAFVRAEHSAGDISPLVTRDRLHEIISENIPR